MTPKQLTYFLRIAELGSFTRAAAVLYVAQPALSRQIKQLEEDLGVLLFARSDTGIRLTEAGVLLAERARSLLQQFESLRSEVGALGTSVQGKLHFGMPTSLFDMVTVPLMTRYRTQYPAVHLGVTEGISSTVYQMVVAGELDVGVVSSTEAMSGLEQQPLIRESLFLAYPASLPVDLSPDGSVSLDQVARHPLGLTRWPNAMRVTLDEAARAQGLKITSLFDSNSSRLMIKAVVNGLGCTVNTYSALYEGHRSGAVQIAPIRDLSNTWTLIYSRERGMPVAGQKLAELVVEIAGEGIASGIWPGAELV
ncbi:MAG: LysR family transcriptional regulator [Polaromonas sp.]|nr:LysR family transcriptional regulator [Polaromonas sp.]